MRANSSCPLQAELLRFAQAEPPEDELSRFADHLEGCTACAEAIECLHVDDTIVKALCSANSVDLSVDSAMEEMMTRVQVLGELKFRAVSAETLSLTASAWATSVGTPAGSNLDEDVLALLSPPQRADELGRLGPYRILQKLGRGGMGVVFLAEDPTLKRLCAIKAMLPRLAAEEANRKRFLLEARATARIHHDHVVTVFQADESGRAAYFAMEYLRGESLESRLRRDGRLSLREVLRIGREVAEGLAAAHAHDLVHRDIKPSNLWLEEGRKRVKILDFGLVRAIEGAARLTELNAIVGTPAYMSPEQMDGGQVDCRTDLFSLGRVLDTLATGVFPFEGQSPMQIFIAVAAGESHDPGGAIPPGELRDLIRELLAREPNNRPESAQHVAARLVAMERSLSPNGQSASTPRQGTSRAASDVPWIGHAGRTALLACLMLTIVAAGWIINVMTDYGTLTIETECKDATISVKSDRIIVLEGKLHYEIKLTPGEYDLDVRGPKAGLAPSKQRVTIRRGSEEKIAVAPNINFVRRSIPPLKLAQAGDGDPLAAPPELVAIFGDGRFYHQNATSVAWSPDGKLIASGGHYKVRLWDTDGQLVRVIRGGASSLSALAFNSTSDLLALTNNAGDIMLLKVATGETVDSWRFATDDGYFPPVAFHPTNPSLFATGSINGDIFFWIEGKRDPVKTLIGHTKRVQSLSWSRDGKRLASGAGEGSRWEPKTARETKIWDVATGKEAVALEDKRGVGNVVALAPNGTRLVAGNEKGQLHCWDAETGRHLSTIEAHGGNIDDLAFDTQGARVISCAHDGCLQVRRADSLDLVQLCPTHSHHPLRALAVNPTGASALGVNIFGKLLLWNTTTGQQPFSLHHTLHRLVMARDGKSVWSSSLWPPVLVRSSLLGPAAQPVQCLPDLAGGEGRGIAISPSGKWVAVAYIDGGVSIWDTGTERCVRQLRHAGSVFDVEFLGNDDTLVTCGTDKRLRLWSLRTGESLADIGTDAAYTLATSRDGRHIAAAGIEKLVLWDVDARKQSWSMRTDSGQIGNLAFGPTGEALFAADVNGHVLAWRTSTGKPLWRRTLSSYAGAMALAVSQDGRQIATVMPEGTIRLLDPATGETLRSIRSIEACAICFTLDGKHLITNNTNNTAYVLRLTE